MSYATPDIPKMVTLTAPNGKSQRVRTRSEGVQRIRWDHIEGYVIDSTKAVWMKNKSTKSGYALVSIESDSLSEPEPEVESEAVLRARKIRQRKEEERERIEKEMGGWEAEVERPRYDEEDEDDYFEMMSLPEGHPSFKKTVQPQLYSLWMMLMMWMESTRLSPDSQRQLLSSMYDVFKARGLKFRGGSLQSRFGGTKKSRGEMIRDVANMVSSALIEFGGVRRR